MNKRGNKKGQFYLVAAIIIITIAAGFIAVSNYASSQPLKEIYYLKEEIKIESSRTMDYLALNPAVSLKDTMANLSEEYINHTFGNNFYFLFGDDASMTFLAYKSTEAVVSLEETGKTISMNQIYSEDFVPSGDVNLTINGNEYVFKLNIGNNYRFIISNEKGGQVYTVVG